MERKAFEKVLKLAKKIVPANAYMPILSYVRLTGDGVTLRVSGTNLKTSCRFVVPCEWKGDVAVNLKDLVAAVSAKAPQVELALIVEGERERLQVTVGGSVCKLSTFPVDEMPMIPELGLADGEFWINGESLRAALKRCLPMASTDTVRPYIYGVNMRVMDGETLALEACDGHRCISENHMPVSFSGKAMDPRIIVRDAIPALLDILSGEVKVYLTTDYTFFAGDAGVVAVRTIEAEFPPLECVIPNGSDRAMTVNRLALSEAMKGALCAIKANGGKVNTVQLGFAENAVQVSVNYPEEGTFANVVPCRCEYTDEKVGFNPKYVLDALDACEGEDVTIGFNSGFGGALIREGESRTIVVMPVRD